MDEELKAMLESAKAQGASDTDLGSIIDMYEADASKKKGKSIATATPPKSVSGTPTGSSVGKNSSGFPKIDMNSVAPGYGEQPDYNAINLAKSKRIKELETSFYASTKDDNDDAVAEQRLQDRKANKGFWNTAEDLTKSAYNKVVGGIASITDEPGIKDLRIDEDPLADEKKQAFQEAKKNKVTLSEIQKNARAEEIFKEKERDNLFIDRANSYLDNLDVKDKDILQQSRSDKAVHLQLENKKKLQVVSAMETVGNEKIKEYQDVEKQLLELKKNGQEFPKDLFEKYSNLGTEINQISGNIQKYSDQIQKNKSDLGTAKQEFDLFKRTYSDADNFIGNAIATTGELANGIFGAVNYFASLSPDPITRLNSMRGQEISNQIAGGLEEYRGVLRKPVESVESVEGFVNYASDLVSNQLPVLAVTSTGAGGLVALGASTTGQTFTKINQENLTGKANYSPLQMAAIPLLQGGFEVISEIPTLSILKKGSRVISAAANGEIDLIKKSGGELFKGYAKDFGKEFGGEHITNLGQNFNARYVQGKEDVGLLDNTGRVSKDTAFLTTLLQGSPHVLGAVVKVFQSNQDFGTLDENSRKIIEFSKQLNTEGLTDTEKTVIQKQIDKVTAESSKIITNTIGKIGDMPNISYDEIISLNSQAGKIKAQAKEIKDGKLPNKEALLTSLGQDYKELQTKRNGLIDGSITPFDLLSGNDQAKRLTEASREITKRDNPDGTKAKFEVKPEDAKELASENYLKEIKEKEIVDDKQVEQTSTPEAQPQAEVPQQAEAEKVNDATSDAVNEVVNDAVSPVEDVVATSVSEEQKMQFGAGYKDYNFKNKIVSTDKIKITEQPSLSERQELVDDIRKNGITEPIVVEYDKESDSYYVKNGNHRAAIAKELGIKEVPTIVAEYKETNNEATQGNNITPNASIRPTATNVGESGITEQESPAKEGVSKPVDGGEGKGDASVGEVNTPKKIYHATNAEFDGLPNKVGKRVFDIGAEPAGIFYSTDAETAKQATGEGNNQRIVEATFEPKNTLVFDDYKDSENSRIYEDAKKQAEEETIQNLKSKGMSDEDVQMWKENEVLGQVPKSDTEGGFFAHKFADILKGKGFDSVWNTRTNDIIVLDQSITKEAKPKKVAVDKKSVPLPNLEDIADFINQTYLNDGKQENNPTAEADKGAKKNSVDENSKKSPSEGKAKKISLKGRTPLSKRKFKGDRAKASNVEVTDEYSLVLNHFVTGGKISSDYVQESLSEGDKKAKNNSFNGIASKSGKGIDALAHDLWDNNHNLDIAKIKESIEDVVRSHNTVQDITDTILKANDVSPEKTPEEYADDYANHYEVKEEQEASDKVMQEAESTLDFLSDAEIIELAESQEKSYDDFIKDLEKRQVTFDWFAFEGERGTIQNDGNILNDEGEFFAKEDVSNVKQLYPDPKSNKLKSSWETNIEALVNPNTGLASTISKMDAGQKEKETFLNKKGLSFDDYGKMTSEEKQKIQDDWVKSKEFKELNERKSKPSISKDTPELKEVNAKLEKANEKLRVAKDALDRKAKLLDKELLKDNEDIFGERKNQNENKLFNERVDGNARNKATEKERKAVKDAEAEIKALTETKAKIESGEIASTKEMIFAEVDRIAQQAKDWLPGINDPDLKKQGISQDQLIDLIATAVKNLISKGIDVNDAIKQVVESIKAKFGDIDIDVDAVKAKIDPKAVEERISPKKEAGNDFKSKSGKKSLLVRLRDGGNPDVITKAVKELGDNYDVRNQQEANDEAMAFIDKVGASEALKAIKDGLITNSDVKMLIYDEALTRLKTEISDEMDKNPEDREALIKKFQEVSDDFDNAVRDAGQGIAILNFIYNKNQTLKYNLKKQIADWKRNDPNNEIPADVEKKFEELDQKLRDLEEKTKEAEVRAKKAEDELAIKNIQEDVERKNQAARKNKSGLTPQEQNRKKQLRDKFARANDVTGIPALLADPEFREYLGLVFKTAKGDFANFSNEILKDLGKTARQHLPELFANAGGKGDVKVTDLQSITISEEGKIKIPAQLLRDYVEQGYNNIDEIAALIKDDIADEFPDADVKGIRDALTGYGKQINPNKDEITAQVNKLKEYGRLLSAYDDVMNGEMPKKSGLVRPKSEQKSRELRRKINRLAKELNIEPVDLEKQWANALDKVKSHLENQIEDLNKQITNGEKRKVDRTPIKLDETAEKLKATRDALKQQLDDLVGKPELTEEQKIASAEKSLETSIKKIQGEIDTNDIAFKEKPTAVTSAKIEQLKATKKALLETKKQLRQEAGLIEQQRLKTTKTRIKNQIEDLNNRIKNKDFAKKEIKPIIADSELNTLRAEKEAVYEEYEKMKYLQELQNRTLAKKIMDEGLEALGLARAIKASLDLGLIGIQLRGFTYSELWRNPKELGRKFVKLFGAIGSQKKANNAMAELIGDPDFALAKKLDIGITNPDLRNEVREEMASGNLLHFIWSSPVLAAEALGAKEFMNSKRSSVGDSFINSAKTEYNKLFKNYQVEIKQKEKFSIKEQWRNINAFEAVERGLSAYGNRLRFEEFKRGIERLRAEGKDEINHLEDYKLLASYIRTFSGRAKPAGFELNQKALNVFFFSFKNMASVVQQLNPVYYGLQHINSTDFKNGNYFKPSVANKMAMATMFKSVTSTAATLLFVIATYNAFKDDDDEEATIEKDPRSSDFGKLKIGTFRYDPWGGYIPLITLYARLLTESYKKDDGKIYKFGEEYNSGKQNIADAISDFFVNKESPAFAIGHKFTKSTLKIDPTTGEYRRILNGKPLMEDDSFNFSPIFLHSVAQAKEKDYEGVQAFLTAYSVLGLGNVQDYEKSKNSPTDKFSESQAKIKEYNDLPKSEKEKVDANNRVVALRQKVAELENFKRAKLTNTPYLVKGAERPADLSNFDVGSADKAIVRLNAKIEEYKTKAGDKYKAPKD